VPRTSLQKSQKQEKTTANRYGGSVNAGSGNGWVRKSDVRTADVLFEMKYTDAKSYSLKAADLKKAEDYALVDGREMAFGISFSGVEYMVLPEEYYHRLHAALHTEESSPS
jgi:hypothetical protein